MTTLELEAHVGPTPRWTPMRTHPERERLLNSLARHRLVAAGRGSGKTEDAKRIVLIGDRHHHGAMCPPYHGARFFIAGPTRDQVKDIWWQDLKALCPPEWLRHKPNETELRIDFVTGSTLRLIGLDVPERGEGNRYAGGIVTETQKIKPHAWTESLEPTLYKIGQDIGWSLREGRPCGRNHFWKWWTEAKTKPDHDSFHWPSSAVMEPAMVEAARHSMDPRSFAQEFNADWLTQTGLVYYQFDANKHLRAVRYDPTLPLVFAFDFNVAPGSAVVLQEQKLPPWDQPQAEPSVATTCVIGEVYVPDNSHTQEVCAELRTRFAAHTQLIQVYGDPSGNQRRTSARSTDWDQVEQELRRTFRAVSVHVGREQPGVVDSVNSTNTRMLAADGAVRFALNPQLAPQTLLDLEGVAWEQQRTNERHIDKSDDDRTHWSDAVRYYVHERFPLGGFKASAIPVRGF